MKKRYFYDISRATKVEPLARMLRRCALVDRPTGTDSSPGISLCSATGVTSTIISQFQLRDRTVFIGINSTTNHAFDFCGSPARPDIIPYPDKLLPHAEDAYSFYVTGHGKPDGVYLPSDVSLLKFARQYLRKLRLGEVRIYDVPGEDIPLIVRFGLEHLDCKNFDQTIRSRFIAQYLHARAASNLLYAFAAASTSRSIRESADGLEIGPLSEIAYGPLPRTRFAESYFEKEAAITYSLPPLLLAAASARGMEMPTINILRGDHEGIISNARSLLLRIHPEQSAESMVLLVREIHESISRLTPHQSVANPVRPSPVVPAMRPKKPDAVPTNVVSIPRSIPKPQKENFISLLQRRFIGNASCFLEALYALAKPSELAYVLDKPSALEDIIRRYRDPLEAQHFDVGHALGDMKKKGTKMA